MIHEDHEVITAAHRYAYIIKDQNAHGRAYEKAVLNSKQRFQTKSADDSIMVRLDTKPPLRANGPSYRTALALNYACTGLYAGAYAHRLVYPQT